jgi:hypothetical protein
LLYKIKKIPEIYNFIITAYHYNKQFRKIYNYVIFIEKQYLF